ncbi:hypothetical protein BDY19DRAFT_986593 [Irpex rosettiformis]|uniref:Uncharacterized protein n=1 Tax=Irpex rosettiformis TaxID=378272 RepID=A0ACB8TXA7_9APHY|nr:hypothetical protein BDY19DRAFT_986593 [Irpex rosettiformis]
MFSADDEWKKSSVKIHVPKEGVKYASEDDTPEFEVKGIWHQSLLGVIKSAYEDKSQKYLHNIPFKLYHCDEPTLDSDSTMHNSSDSAPGEHVWTELYNSDAVLEEQVKIDALSRNSEDADTVEYVATPIMEYSDASHLTSFESAYLWPIYNWIGALTKYLRVKPSSLSAHHIAYIPKDFYLRVYNTAATPDVLQFCRSQLVQKIWDLLLNEKFMHTYQHRILVMCSNGIIRCLFLRIIMYSADYPERIALACMHFLMRCPCPICLVHKEKIMLMSSKCNSLIAMAHKWVFEKEFSIGSAMINHLLASIPLVLTRSTFSECFSSYNFNFYSMFVPDVLHEFELGVFKAIFAHNLWILYLFDFNNLTTLNSQ